MTNFPKSFFDRYLFIGILLYLGGLIILRSLGEYQLPFLIAYTFLSVGFSILICHEKFFGLSESFFDKRKETFTLVMLLLVSILVRLSFVSKPLQLSLDVEAYTTFGKLLLDNKSPFIGTNTSAYPPLVYLFFSIACLVSKNIFFMKFLMILADSLISLLLYKLSKIYLEDNKAAAVSLIYAFNPVSLVEVGWNGHFDSLPSLLTLTSLYFLTKKKFFSSSVSLALASMLKWYPLFLLPLFIAPLRQEKRRFFEYLLVFTTVCIITFIPLLILFPVDFSSAVVSRVMNTETSYSRSLTEYTYKSSKILFPGMFDVRKPIFHILLGVSVFLSLSYLLNINILKKMFIFMLFLYLIHLTLFSLANVYSYAFHTGNLFPLSRLYLIFFSLIALFFVVRLLWHVRQVNSVPKNLPVCISLVTQLLVLAQPNFAPKYFIWIIPFILLLNDRKIRNMWLMILLFSLPLFYYGPLYFKALVP